MEPVTPPIGQPHADVIARQLGDGAVLVHLGTNTIFELNRTGARIWDLLIEGLGIDAIAGRLVDEFDVELPMASREVHQLIDRLSATGLLRT